MTMTVKSWSKLAETKNIFNNVPNRKDKQISKSTVSVTLKCIEISWQVWTTVLGVSGLIQVQGNDWSSLPHSSNYL